MLKSTFTSLFNAPRQHKQLLMLLADISLILLALWLAFALRLSSWQPEFNGGVLLFLLAPLISLPIFIRFGLYRSVIRYINNQALMAVLSAVTLSVVVILASSLLLKLEGIPRSIYIIYWFIALLLIGGCRYSVRQYYAQTQNANKRINIAIYGAGQSGTQLAQALANSPEYRPKLFLDDRQELHKQLIHGLKVYPTQGLESLISSQSLKQVLLAIPSATTNRRREIIQSLTQLPIHVKTIPSLDDIVSGKSDIHHIKELDISELLGRPSVKPKAKLMTHCITNQSVMVTGAGGSIGSELCRQIIQQQPKRLILFEVCEYALYQIEQELIEKLTHVDFAIELVAILGNVKDQQRVKETLQNYSIDTLYHAAAYKHVPLVEANPIEGVLNNVFGTLHTAQAAIEAKVKHFVCISTDKAVRPTNVMGASKRMAELVLQGLDKLPHQTCFSMVRFGNVLGSSGSVIPLFRKQIEQGGPITLTHEDITRYFMTIPEASQLVIQAGALGTGGDVFLLDMGDSIRIKDLAKRMILLSGLSIKSADNPHGDIEIVTTGLRAGEKLYEELLIDTEATFTQHPQILHAIEKSLSWPAMQQVLSELEIACSKRELVKLLTLLTENVDGYQCQHSAFKAIETTMLTNTAS